jgi:hypothetical protein
LWKMGPLRGAILLKKSLKDSNVTHQAHFGADWKRTARNQTHPNFSMARYLSLTIHIETDNHMLILCVSMGIALHFKTLLSIDMLQQYNSPQIQQRKPEGWKITMSHVPQREEERCLGSLFWRQFPWKLVLHSICCA